MKKKIFLSLTLVMLLCIAFALVINAGEVIETWDISGDGWDDNGNYTYCDVYAELSVNDNDSSYYTLRIYGTGYMYDWGSASDVPWYSYAENILYVEFEDNVLSIGDYAFAGCSSLSNFVFTAAYYDVSILSIGDYAFYECGSLSTFDFPDSIATIGDYAFYHCYSLQSLYFGDSLSSIGEYAFEECYNVEDIIFPSYLNTIGYSAFSYCSYITSVDIPNASVIGDYAFHRCTSLASVTLGNGVNTIGNGAFYECYELSSLTIGQYVSKIGEYAFYDCDGLTELVLGESITSIEYDAFRECDGLERVTINAGADIYEGAFSKCTSLKYVDIGNSRVYDNPFDGCTSLETIITTEYFMYDGVLYDSDCTTLLIYLSGKKDKSYKMPNSIKYIDEYAFKGAIYLEEITISNKVTQIPGYAFYNCTALKKVNLGTGVKYIRSNAFSHCSNLSQIDLSNVSEVGDYAFTQCYNLRSITVGSNCKTISYSAFQGCYKLVEIYNKSGLSLSSSGYGNIGYYALNIYTTEGGNKLYTTDDGLVFFDNGTSCYLISYEGNATSLILPESFNGKSYEIYQYAFYENSSLTDVTISNGVTKVGSYAFANSELTRVLFSDSVKVIGDNAFYYCESLKNVVLGKGVTSVGASAFYNCPLYFAYIPANVETIGDYCFQNYSSYTITKIYCEAKSKPSGWGNYIYHSKDPFVWGCDSFTLLDNGIAISSINGCPTIIGYVGNSESLTLPEEATTVASYAFYDCNTLKNLTIPSCYTTIGSYAFAKCESLASLTVSDGAAKIGDNAFENCSALTSVDLGGVTTLGAYAFYRCTALTHVDLCNISAIGRYAFAYSTSLTSVDLGNVTVISSSAFASCTSLSSIDLSGVTTIEEYAFENCPSLSGLFIPLSVTTIGKYAFNTWSTTVVIYCEATEKQSGWHDYWNNGCSSVYGVTMSGITEDGFAWSSDGNTVTISKYTGNAVNVVIPEYINGMPVTIIGKSAFEYNDSIMSVVIPDTVTTIDSKAFYDCDRLYSVTLGKSVSTIATNAFYAASYIVEVYNRSSIDVTTISVLNSAINIYTPESGQSGVYIVDDYVFCSNGTTYYLVDYIGTDKFIYLPKNINGSKYTINGYTFTSEDTVEIIVISEGVETIKKCAFYDMDSLRRLYIGDVGYIETYGIYYCENAELFIKRSSSSGFASWFGENVKDMYWNIAGVTDDGFVYEYYKEGNRTYAEIVKYWGDEKDIVIPQTIDGKPVIHLDVSTFNECQGISSIAVPIYLEDVGYYFSYSDHNSSFYEDSKNVTVYLEAVFDQHSLSYYRFGDATLVWGYNNITTNSLFDYVLVDGEAYVTRYKGASSDVCIPDTIDGYDVIGFSLDLMDVTSLVIGNNVRVITPYSFYGSNKGCNKLTKVVIGSGVTLIETTAFYNCPVLTRIEFTNSTTELQRDILYLCPSITIDFGMSNISFTSEIVSSCGPLSFEIDENNPYLCVYDGILYTADMKTLVLCPHNRQGDLVIPDTVTTIGAYAFYECDNLTSITLPEGLLSIEAYAFYKCKGLTSIVIPNSVTTIGIGAFEYCEGLYSVTIGKGVKTIGSWAFYSCTKILFVYNHSSISITKGSTDHGYAGYYAVNIYTSDDDFSEIFTDDNGFIFFNDGVSYYLIGYSGTSTELVLPSSCNGKSYEIFRNAFNGLDTITSVVIPEGVTKIGDSAFQGCTALTSVTIGDTVTYLGTSAFEKCKLLEYVKLPAGISEIADYTFYDCIALKEIIIPEGVTTIGEWAFTDCESLESVTLPSTLEVIDYHAFAWCYNLKSIVFPDSLTTIRQSAFSNCDSLSVVSIGSSVTSIGYWAFESCDNLTTVFIPSSVIYIDEGAFINCSNDLTIYCYAKSQPSGWNSNWVDISNAQVFWNAFILAGVTDDGFLYIIDAQNASATITGYSGSSKHIVIPEYIDGYQVEKIGENAFYDMDFIESVIISDNVITIGEYAFYSCDELLTVTVGEDVYEIQYDAFYSCTKLYEVCDRSTSLSFRTGSTYMGYISYYAIRVISGDDATSQIITTEDGFMFLEDESSSYHLIGYNGGSLDIVLPDSINGNSYSIGNYAFYKRSFTSVVIPEGVTTIGNDAFKYCQLLRTVVLPESLTSIGEDAFYDCYNLNGITIGKNVTNIGRGAFGYCDSIKTVFIPKNVTSIGYNAFDSDIFCHCEATSKPSGWDSYWNGYNNSKKVAWGSVIYDTTEDGFVLGVVNGAITVIEYTGDSSTIIIPAAATAINASVFKNRTNITSVYIHKNVKSIGEHAFYGCSNIAEIIVEAGNTSYVAIDNVLYTADKKTLVFCAKKNAVTEITLPDETVEILPYAFHDCDTITSVVMGKKLTTIGDYAFYTCGALTTAKLNDGLATIGKYAFQNCSSLTEIVIPDSITVISNYAFYACSKLTSVTLGKGVTTIGGDSFRFCSALESIVIPENVTSIGTSAFHNCSKLSSVTILEGLTTIGDYAFYYCNALESISLPNSVTSIGFSAFAWCSNLKKAFIPISVTTMSGSVFSGSGDVTVYVEAETLPDDWNLSWSSGGTKKIVWGYSHQKALSSIYTFKGYSLGPNGSMAVGFDINYTYIALYEEATGKTIDIGVVFAGFNNLGGKQPLDENGNPVSLSVGRVAKASLKNLNYQSYDFILRGIDEKSRDVKVVIAGYIYDGENVIYIQGKEISDTVVGISYNELYNELM